MQICMVTRVFPQQDLVEPLQGVAYPKGVQSCKSAPPQSDTSPLSFPLVPAGPYSLQNIYVRPN